MKSLNRKRFTQQGIERLRYDKAGAPPSGRIEIEDEACPGLLLRVTPRNVKSFSVIYRVLGEGGTSPKGRLLAGKQHRITLGATPPLELTAARRQARDIMQAATEGRDLRTERREKNLIRSVNTFEAVFKTLHGHRDYSERGRLEKCRWRVAPACDASLGNHPRPRHPAVAHSRTDR